MFYNNFCIVGRIFGRIFFSFSFFFYLCPLLPLKLRKGEMFYAWWSTCFYFWKKVPVAKNQEWLSFELLKMRGKGEGGESGEEEKKGKRREKEERGGEQGERGWKGSGSHGVINMIFFNFHTIHIILTSLTPNSLCSLPLSFFSYLPLSFSPLFLFLFSHKVLSFLKREKGFCILITACFDLKKSIGRKNSEMIEFLRGKRKVGGRRWRKGGEGRRKGEGNKESWGGKRSGGS